jgi:hypothetical protein
MKKRVIFILVMFCLAVATNALSANTNSVDLRRGNSQYFSITDADQAGLDITGDMTIEAWVKIESDPIGAFYTIVSKWSQDTNDRSYAIDYYESGGTYYLRMLTSSDGSTATTGTIVKQLTTGTWHHLAFVYDASAGSCEVFVNASNIGTITGLTTSLYSSASDFRIGVMKGNTSLQNYFDGLIDEVRIWNGLRTAQEIADNYQKELTGGEPNLVGYCLVGYWKFNGNATDMTGRRNNLTNRNGAVFSPDVPFVGTTSTSTSTTPSSTCSIQGAEDGISSIADVNGDGVQEMLTWGTDAVGIPVVCISDITTSSVSLIKEISFFDSSWTLIGVSATSDMSSPADGLADIAALATNGSETRIRVKDYNSGALIQDILLP